MSKGTTRQLRSALLAGLAGLALVFGSACNDEGAVEDGGGVVEEGGDGEEGDVEE